jgi:hypothetical protein
MYGGSDAMIFEEKFGEIGDNDILVLEIEF